MLARCFILFVILSPVQLVGQPQVYQFKELQRYLPADNFDNYVRGKPTGETSSMMGFATSWVQVVYELSTDTSRSAIIVKITDMINLPSYMNVGGDVDQKTQSGYERTVLYKDIRVLESFDSAAHTLKLQLPVANRFLVEITGTGVESSTSLYDALDRTDLEGLKRLVQSGSR